MDNQLDQFFTRDADMQRAVIMRMIAGGARQRDAGGNAMKDRHGSRTTVTWARAATGNGANTGVVKPSRTGEPGDPVVTSACIMVPGSIAERNVPPGSNR